MINLFTQQDTIDWLLQLVGTDSVPGLSADGGECTHPSTVQLVAAASPHDLKVQSLVKLTELLWLETQADQHLSIGRDYPAKDGQPTRRQQASQWMLTNNLV